MGAPRPGHGDEQPGVRVTPQLVLGLLVIVAGVLFLLDNLGIATARAYLRYWPVGLVAIGLLKIWQSREGCPGAFAGFIFTFAGVWLLLEELALVRIRLNDLWPLFLVFFGAYLVWQGISGRKRPPEAGDDDDRLSAFAMLGAVARGNNSPSFRGGTLTAIMGGCEIDLRHASIDGEAVIDVFAMWGGIDIRVPEDWSVHLRVVPLLGGADDKTRPPQGTSPHRLVLRGFAIMGGIEVKN